MRRLLFVLLMMVGVECYGAVGFPYLLQTTNSVTTTNLDNALWLDVLTARLPRLSNYNGGGLKNTAWRLQQHKTIRTMMAGGGLVQGGLVNQVNVRLQDYIPLAGTSVNSPYWYSATTGSGVTTIGKDTNWHQAYPMMTRLGDTITWQTANGLTANVICLPYETFVYGGHFKVQTNIAGGTYTDVSGMTDINSTSNRHTAKILWITNGSVQTMNVRVVAITADATNVFPDCIAINDTLTNGLIMLADNVASDLVANMILPPPAVLKPIYQAMSPDLWLENTITTPSDLVNVAIHYNFLRTNLPNTDVVICGTYQLDEDGAGVAAETRTCNNCFRTNSVNRNFMYFDGSGAFDSYTNTWVARGLAHDPPDNVHLGTPGWPYYGNLLWSWLNIPSLLTETLSFKPQQIPGLVAMFDAAQLTNVNNGTVVRFWPDVSGNGFDVRSVGGVADCYWTNNSQVLNGRPWVQFGTVSDLATNSATIWAQPNTYFFIGHLQSGSGTYLFDAGNFSAGAGGRNALLANGANIMDQYAGTEQKTPPIMPLNDFGAFFFYYNGALSYQTLNGLRVSTNFASVTIGSQGQQGLSLGSDYQLANKGDPAISLFGWWNRTLTTNEINALLFYANTNYGVRIYQASSAIAAPVSISFPATTVNWTNPVGCTIQLIIDNSGASGTAIKKNGTTVVAGVPVGFPLILKPGEYFSQTYSAGTPTATWTIAQ